ncbi:hypothetical protein [Streptomyces sp. NBC_01244]|uniref:hypothetical protein n=1 Tax=Streptomyces sp. NBC_01244 TaxID=2903797 RepID=UPI002E1301A8|nr:hypothetical protein OG247_35010 [Streptomyces sp. NBC_01244]
MGLPPEHLGHPAHEFGVPVLGQADGFVSQSAPAAAGSLAQELRQRAPGISVLAIDGNSEFPVWVKERTVSVRYVDTDWSSPLMKDRYRLLSSDPAKPDTRREVGDALLSDPVDVATLTRASAYVTTATARALGATTVDYSVITSPSKAMPDLEERLVKALEPVDLVMADVRIETGPELTPPSRQFSASPSAGA